MVSGEWVVVVVACSLCGGSGGSGGSVCVRGYVRACVYDRE